MRIVAVVTGGPEIELRMAWSLVGQRASTRKSGRRFIIAVRGVTRRRGASWLPCIRFQGEQSNREAFALESCQDTCRQEAPCGGGRLSSGPTALYLALVE